MKGTVNNMSNQHLQMQEDLYSEIEYHLARLYDEETRTFIYNGERITKFNFEEVASDDNFLDHHFESIHIKIWDMFGLQLTLEEQAELNDHVLNKLYELLEEDVQELRASERP